ncbi:MULTISPECIES: hypothetical protein [Parabacteroides]|jgi:hypothetical protein|uniref:NigD-like OB domain-containing protein n=1 Tax=Parabacteroides faecis TaxID=1217282 RepID=A0ABR6KMH9_9BACT|nr:MULTISPECIES: hypothetical protein [Parabacteroides]MBB4622710.1 hypothetical protein [Parabacteroides faecis]RHR36322.1 hypothetical protein DWX23_21100 [Parabacteroides sp. AF18-52]GGK08546.1 hypothetical protein GCM10007084_34520 [Parabacteroides faecis]
MKKLKSLGAVAVATVLLTSCLDGNNESSLNGIGVIDYSDDFRTVAYIDDYTPVYSPVFKDLKTGDCIYFTSTYSSDDPANNGSNKYVTVTNAVVTNKIDNDGYFNSQLDTANIKPGEITALNAGLLYATQYSYTLKNYLFVGSSHEKVPADQDNTYFLEYDYSQEPQTVDGKRVYDFFLRIVKNADGKGVVGTNPFNYAFNTHGYFKTLQSKETAAGNETLNIRINYIKEFNKDTTAATWAKSQIYQTQILKETN